MHKKCDKWHTWIRCISYKPRDRGSWFDAAAKSIKFRKYFTNYGIDSFRSSKVRGIDL